MRWWATACVIVLAATAAGQEARSTGAARFPVLHRGAYGVVLVHQGARVAGQGEIVPLLRGAAGQPVLAEFRGFVPAGRFRLGPVQETPRAVLRPEPPQGAGLAAESASVIHGDGVHVPRWRWSLNEGGLRVTADLHAWPDGELELRAWLQAEKEFDAARGARVELRLQGRLPALVHGPGLLVEASGRGPCLLVPPGHLRPGDACLAVLRTGDDATDPGQRVWPARQVLAHLGLDKPRAIDAPTEGTVERLHQDLNELLRARPLLPLERGDFVRRFDREGTVTWTHGEFDLALGLLVAAHARRNATWREAGRESALHALGRDAARPWEPATAGIALPVRHGQVHGRGVVDPGHVFLEGCWLHGLLDADRLVLERASRGLDELADLALAHAPRAERLREVAWPLRNLETALLASPDQRWKTAADRLVRALQARFDPLLEVPIFPDDRLEWGTRLDTWILCGLALPALEASRARGNAEAADVVARLRRVLLALPRPAGVVGTHYVHSWRGGWAASAQPPEPCAQAWVVEGLWLDPALRHLARRQSRSALAALPGTTWDSATRLALCLRLAWLRGPLP